MPEHYPSLAPSIPEIVVSAEKRILTMLLLQAGRDVVETELFVKYLGLIIDGSLETRLGGKLKKLNREL